MHLFLNETQWSMMGSTTTPDVHKAQCLSTKGIHIGVTHASEMCYVHWVSIIMGAEDPNVLENPDFVRAYQLLALIKNTYKLMRARLVLPGTIMDTDLPSSPATLYDRSPEKFKVMYPGMGGNFEHKDAPVESKVPILTLMRLADILPARCSHAAVAPFTATRGRTSEQRRTAPLRSLANAPDLGMSGILPLWASLAHSHASGVGFLPGFKDLRGVSSDALMSTPVRPPGLTPIMDGASSPQAPKAAETAQSDSQPSEAQSISTEGRSR